MRRYGVALLVLSVLGAFLLALPGAGTAGAAPWEAGAGLADWNDWLETRRRRRTPSPTRIATATSPTLTPTPPAIATSTSLPTASATASATRTPSPAASATPSRTPTPTRTPTPSPTSPTATPAPGGAIAVGAMVNGFVWTNQFQDDYEAMVGRRMDIIHWFQPWGQERSIGDYQPVLDREALDRAVARGGVPMITWEAWGRINGVDPSHVANITSGHFDAYIDSWAQGLAEFGRPVYLRLFHEMNIAYAPWAYGTNGNTAEDLIAAWRYVHDRFRRAGATNVRWVWCPNTEDDRIGYRALYPGDAYVDWFGVDGYNGGTELPHKGGWTWPEPLFGRSFASLAALNPGTPIMLAETSSVEGGGSKAEWITRLYLDLPRAHPGLKAILWWQHDGRAEPRQADWRVNTSQAALDAYRAVVVSGAR